MSKKHFIALAAALKAINASFDVVTAIGQVCQSHNPKFNWATFMRAAGH